MADEVDNRYFGLGMKLGCCLIARTSVLLFLCSIVFCVLKMKEYNSYVIFLISWYEKTCGSVSRFEVENPPSTQSYKELSFGVAIGCHTLK